MTRIDLRAHQLRQQQCHDELRAELHPVPNFLDDDILASRIAHELRDVPAHIVLLAVKYEWARRKAFNVPEIGSARIPPACRSVAADATQDPASAADLSTQEFAA